MHKGIFTVALGTVLMCGAAAIAQQSQEAAVVSFDGDAQPESRAAAGSAVVKHAAAQGVAKSSTDPRRGPKATMTVVQTQATAPRAAAPTGGLTGQPLASEGFNTWFNAYRGFQTGRGRLRTAESGQVEMATSEITEGEAAEAMEYGGIPRSQARRRRAGVGTAMPGSASWFNAGSPFGIRYGYGSGFGYGGYGYDNPYGYGSRSGSGGAYGYGFAAFGSVGGQTGERLSSLITGPAEEGGRLIGPEPASFAAPARLETAVGGTYGKAGAGARKLGGSAAERE